MLLTIKGLSAQIEDKQVLVGVDLAVGEGELTALTGANGSGKTSLSQVLLGNKNYEVTGGKVLLDDLDLLSMSPDERARAGLYVSWQNPPMIPGVSVFTLCKASYEAMGHTIPSVVAFKKQLEILALRVGLTPPHIARSVNEGFSGGERKRLELLQLLLVKPRLVILDEIDSGLDASGREMVVQVVKEMHEEGVAFIVISHYRDLLIEIGISKVWEMSRGRI